MQRKPINITAINPMGYVATRCYGTVMRPVIFKERPPRTPRSVSEAMQTNYAQRLAEYEQRRRASVFQREAQTCNYECAVTPGVESKCPNCGGKLFVPRIQPQPFADRAFKDAQDRYDWRAFDKVTA